MPLPTVYGYARMRVEAQDVEVLVMGRLAYTGDELLEQVGKEERSMTLALMVENMAVRTLTEMMRLPREEHLRVHDWHTGNIAFKDAENGDMVLIDWQDYVVLGHPLFNRDIKSCFLTFLKSLDYRLSEMGPSWKGFMLAYRDVLQQWWRLCGEIPTRNETEVLCDRLRTITCSMCRVEEYSCNRGKPFE